MDVSIRMEIFYQHFSVATSAGAVYFNFSYIFANFASDKALIKEERLCRIRT